MAGVAKITKEQIFAAAEAIQAEGKNPTLAAVRAAVGGGSFTTISEAMTEWKAGQAVSDTPIREPLPPALDEAAARLMFEVWGVAMGMANDRLKSEREALEVARVEHEQAQAETAEMADQLAEEIDALRMENESLKQTLEESIQDTIKAREELHAEQIKSSALNERIKELPELRKEIERLRAIELENAKLETKIEQLQKHNEKQREVFQASILDAVKAAAGGSANQMSKKTIKLKGDDTNDK